MGVSDAALIDEIESVRASNNVEWMTILRIALAANPADTKAVLMKIEQNDRDIHDNLRRLAT